MARFRTVGANDKGWFTDVKEISGA